MTKLLHGKERKLSEESVSRDRPALKYISGIKDLWLFNIQYTSSFGHVTVEETKAHSLPKLHNGQKKKREFKLRSGFKSSYHVYRIY